MASASEATTSSPVTNIISQNLSPSSSAGTVNAKDLPPYHWMVRPCFVYKDEYKDCKSFKARFHQYFVHGAKTDCTHWKSEYDNCLLWQNKDDIEALKKVIDGEKSRVSERLKAHYANDVWEHRTAPPADWNKELPEPIQKMYEGTYLKIKNEDLKSGKEKFERLSGEDPHDIDESFCSIV